MSPMTLSAQVYVTDIITLLTLIIKNVCIKFNEKKANEKYLFQSQNNEKTKYI